MDTVVQENAARGLGEGDKKARLVVLVTGLRADKERPTDCTAVNSRFGFGVTRVEAPLNKK